MISLCCWADFLTIRTYLRQCEGNMWTTSEQHHPRIKWSSKPTLQIEWLKDFAPEMMRGEMQGTRNRKKSEEVCNHPATSNHEWWSSNDWNRAAECPPYPCSTGERKAGWDFPSWISMTNTLKCCCNMKSNLLWAPEKLTKICDTYYTFSNNRQSIQDTLGWSLRPSIHWRGIPLDGCHPPSQLSCQPTRMRNREQPTHETSTNPRYLHRCIAVAPFCQPHRCDRMNWSHSVGLWCAQCASACAEPWREQQYLFNHCHLKMRSMNFRWINDWIFNDRQATVRQGHPPHHNDRANELHHHELNQKGSLKQLDVSSLRLYNQQQRVLSHKYALQISKIFATWLMQTGIQWTHMQQATNCCLMIFDVKQNFEPRSLSQ